MTNRTNEEQEYTVKIHFVDADGFSIEYSYAGDLFNKIPAGSTKRLLDQELSYCQKLGTDPLGGDLVFTDSVYKCDVFYDLSEAPVTL